MSAEIKRITKSIIQYDLLVGIFFSVLLIIFKQYYLSLVFFIGIITSMLNFMGSLYTIGTALNGQNSRKKIFAGLSSILRIIIVISIAMLFSKSIKALLAFLIGFIAHYGVLTFAAIKVQKGSE